MLFRWGRSSVMTYLTIDDMWIEMLLQIMNAGNPVGRIGSNDASTEVIGYHGVLANPGLNVLHNEYRNLSPYYANAELLWYLSGDDRIEMLARYAPSYKNYAEKDGRAHGAYGRRIQTIPCNWFTSQIDAVITCLRKHPSSRQAIVSLWNTLDLIHAADDQPKRDMPCTLTWQFLLRDGELHMVVNMRSNDAWLGFPYDAYCFTSYQAMIAGALGVAVGTYTHNVGSMHIYDKNMRQAQAALSWSLDAYVNGAVKMEHGYDMQLYHSAVIADALSVERAARLNEAHPEVKWKPGSELVRDAAYCCAYMTMGTGDCKERIVSPKIRAAIDSYKSQKQGRLA